MTSLLKTNVHTKFIHMNVVVSTRKFPLRRYILTEASLGTSPRGVNQIFDWLTDWYWGSPVLISKILGVSIDTPDTPQTGPLNWISYWQKLTEWNAWTNKPEQPKAKDFPIIKLAGETDQRWIIFTSSIDGTAAPQLANSLVNIQLKCNRSNL